ncbi:hypothetical protein A7U60_g2072 [Sanghuangporus baumii]|uniref:Nephrocystin 3-like N-terminal domain-containing protein n=1 Tax=Sanghuangporus baumii TaxID=108892 RepID=A0A9Q5I3E2_SANBA|nr:hypothetical protein A7U60_g2072 [Sanghuangporus baumii]
MPPTHHGREHNDELKFLRLKDVVVTFKDRHPRYPVKIKIVVGESVPRSKDFTSHDGDSLRWEADIHLPPSSGLQAIVKESHVIKWRAKKDYASVRVETTDIDADNTMTKEDERGLIVLKLVFETPVKAGIAVRKGAEDAAARLEQKPIALEKLGRARGFVDIVKNFGDFLADATAKAATIAFSMLYERLENQEKIHEDASDLLDDLQEFLPFTEVVDRATMTNEAARAAVKDFLDVFRETCEFIVQYSSSSILGDLISSQGSKVDELKADFKKAKSKYDWSIKTDVWKINLKIEKIRDNDMLKLLQVSSLGPAGKEFYRTDKACLSGTRTNILERISQWATNASDRKLLWVHGSPGSGKSAIANSVAHKFDLQRLLAGCFFCRRDDTDLRDPSKIIPSLATHLAIWHQPYCIKLLSALQGEERNKLASKTLPEHFDMLIKGTILAVASEEETSSPNPLIIVVDGLDECGKTRGQRIQLARILVQTSELVPWLKLLVLSRPMPELNQVFEGSSQVLEKLDLDGAGDPTPDITCFTHHRAKQVARENPLNETWISEDQIGSLVEKSRGRFVWMKTVFDFIESRTDVDFAIETALLAPVIDFDRVDADVGRLCMENLQRAESDLQKT